MSTLSRHVCSTCRVITLLLDSEKERGTCVSCFALAQEETVEETAARHFMEPQQRSFGGWR